MPYTYCAVNPRSTIGNRAFPVAAACAWNSLLSSIRTVSSLNAFRDDLKTVLFKASFEWPDKTAAINPRLITRDLYSCSVSLQQFVCDSVTLIAVIHSFIHSFIHSSGNPRGTSIAAGSLLELKREWYNRNGIIHAGKKIPICTIYGLTLNKCSYSKLTCLVILYSPGIVVVIRYSVATWCCSECMI